MQNAEGRRQKGIAACLLSAFCILPSAFGAPLSNLVLHDANSQTATNGGIKAYTQRHYGAATQSFAKANAYAQSPTTLYNLGTAEIAAGKREEGSAALTAAMQEKSLRADALYNRGNSALAANSYDYAIRDYVEALKIRPSDLATKRNLEIAINRKMQAQQSQSGKQKNPQGSSPQQQQQNQQKRPSAGQQQQQRPSQRDANSEALLRAVQQQEQEELERMKRARAQRGRVGW
ncbi:MAG TPA: tetratricopeptide repeat protein [Thermoanaerobaculia bacterium]